MNFPCSLLSVLERFKNEAGVRSSDHTSGRCLVAQLPRPHPACTGAVAATRTNTPNPGCKHCQSSWKENISEASILSVSQSSQAAAGMAAGSLRSQGCHSPPPPSPQASPRHAAYSAAEIAGAEAAGRERRSPPTQAQQLQHCFATSLPLPAPLPLPSGKRRNFWLAQTFSFPHPKCCLNPAAQSPVVGSTWDLYETDAPEPAQSPV